MKEKLKSITIDKYLALLLFVLLAMIPMVTNLYNTQIFGKFLTYMMVALALDLLWGYGGLMNLGFAVFFGVGGYLFGISLACQNGLPAFMKGLGKLPWFYQPLQSIPVAIVLGIVLPAALALFLGYFIFTSKIKGVFYNLITLAFAGLFELFITTNQVYTGGSSGVNGVAGGLGKLTIHGERISIVQWYYIAYISLILLYLLCLWLTECRFGKVIKSVRDNEARLQFLGYNPAVFKMAVFAIAGAVAGYAGMLYVPMTSFFSIESAGVSFSTMILVWLAVGGRGNLSGAMIGALFVSFLQSKLSSSMGDIWQLVLGVILIAIVLFLPDGVIGSLKNLQYNQRTKKQMQAGR
ncbi:MAG: hypothetical protein J5979_01715 [Lachnospiraceae bacterium]|nr:hypothetical protein [Lachnospiraceae bacterium]